MDELLARRRPLTLRGPFGKITVSVDESRPLLLVAGGTGASQALAIIDDLRLGNPGVDVVLLACADDESDFYFRTWLDDDPRSWLDVTCIADARRDGANRGLRWLEARAGEFLYHRVILSGSPGFVYAACDALKRGGIDQARFESDVFAYAPRE